MPHNLGRVYLASAERRAVPSALSFGLIYLSQFDSAQGIIYYVLPTPVMVLLLHMLCAVDDQMIENATLTITDRQHSHAVCVAAYTCM